MQALHANFTDKMEIKTFISAPLLKLLPKVLLTNSKYSMNDID